MDELFDAIEGSFSAFYVVLAIIVVSVMFLFATFADPISDMQKNISTANQSTGLGMIASHNSEMQCMNMMLEGKVNRCK
jgi:hypothetical protein